MSLENIKDVINHYERHVSPGSYGEAIVRAAREEVEAIEKAAQVVDTCGWSAPSGTRLEDFQHAIDTFRNIAKESSQS